MVGIADAGDGRRPVIVDARRRHQRAVAAARASRRLFQRTQAEPLGLERFSDCHPWTSIRIDADSSAIVPCRGTRPIPTNPSMLPATDVGLRHGIPKKDCVLFMTCRPHPPASGALPSIASASAILRPVDHLPDVDVLGAETGLAIVEIEFPQPLEAVVEAERHDLSHDARKRSRHSASVRA